MKAQNTSFRWAASIATVGIIAHLSLQMISTAPLLTITPLLIAACTLTFLPVSRPAKPLSAFSPLLIVVTLLFASYLLSLAFSTNKHSSLEAFLAILPGPLILMLAMQAAPDSKTMYRFCLGICVSMLVGGVHLVYTYLHNAPMPPAFVMVTNYSAAFVVPNDVLLLVCLLPFAAHLLSSKRPVAERLFAALVIALTSVALAFSESRAGLMVTLLLVAGYLIARRRRTTAVLMAVMLVTVLAVDLLQDSGLLRKTISGFGASARLPLWWAGIESFIQFPLTGNGPGTFDEIYAASLAEGRQLQGVVYDTRRIAWAHSLYIEALAERGLPGLVSLLALFGVGAYYCVRGLSRAAWRVDNQLFPVFASLLALLIAGFVELTLLRTWVVSLTFLLLGLSANALNQESVKHELADPKSRLAGR